MENIKFSTTLFALLLFLQVNAQSLKLFLVAGQSNAEGAGNLDSSVQCPIGTCFEYLSSGDSVRALQDPVGYTAPGEDFQAADSGSAWPSFASTYFQLTGDTVVIVQAAKGGTSCAAAADGTGGNWSPSYHLFSEAVTKAKRAETFTGQQLSGIIWLQGEADAVGIYYDKISADQYKSTLKDLIQRFRDAFRCNLPFYIIQTGLYTPNFNSQFYAVRNVQQQVADEDPLTFVVDSSADTYTALGWMNADQIHFNQHALNVTGSVTAQNIRHVELVSNPDTCYSVSLPPSLPDWNVFPSPFSDQLISEMCNCDCTLTELRITDMLGSTVYKIESAAPAIQPLTFEIPTHSFPQGVYVISALFNNQSELAKKIVKY